MILIYTTFPDKDLAQTIAETLIESRLVACANIFAPHRSVYRWDGEIQNDEETAMILKTTQEKWDAVRTMLEELHPYETPCILALPVQAGAEAFLNWVQKEITE